MKKSRGWITFAIFILLLLAGLILMARPQLGGNSDQDQTGASETFEMSEESYDFGTISMADGNVNHAFRIKNTSADTIKIEKLYTSCMCTEAILTAGFDQFGPFGMPGHGSIPRIGKKVRSGEEVTVEVIYDPTAHGPAGIGPVDRTVFVETDAGMLELRIIATVTP